jgi:2-polyprenyl-3-methyl-5-hydroxy-6-metoxy-1,4-benzoquinol methylase
LEQINTLVARDLVLAYRQAFGVDIAHFFNEPSLRFLRCSSCDLRFFDPLVTGDSTFYEQLSAFDGYYMDKKPEFEFAKRFISPKDLVLEIGGGKGGFGSSLATAQYTGLEFNKEAMQVARDSGIQMCLDSIEVHATKHRENYDVVCTFQVLEHVSNPRVFLEAAMSCLKPGGRLIVSVPSFDSFLRDALNLLLNMPPHHVTIWSNHSLLNMAAIVGARIEHVEHEKVAPYHFKWFVQTAIYRLMRGNPEGNRMLELDHKARFFARVSDAAASASMLIVRPLMRRLPAVFLPNGHSVMAVLRKP